MQLENGCKSCGDHILKSAKFTCACPNHQITMKKLLLTTQYTQRIVKFVTWLGSIKSSKVQIYYRGRPRPEGDSLDFRVWSADSPLPFPTLVQLYAAVDEHDCNEQRDCKRCVHLQIISGNYLEVCRRDFLHIAKLEKILGIIQYGSGSCLNRSNGRRRAAYSNERCWNKYQSQHS